MTSVFNVHLSSLLMGTHFLVTSALIRCCVFHAQNGTTGRDRDRFVPLPRITSVADALGAPLEEDEERESQGLVTDQSHLSISQPFSAREPPKRVPISPQQYLAPLLQGVRQLISLNLCIGLLVHDMFTPLPELGFCYCSVAHCCILSFRVGMSALHS